MRFRFNAFFLLFALILFPAPQSVQAQAGQSLDEAVQNCARYLQGRITRGTRAAFVTVQSENQELGEFVRERFNSVLVNGGWFTVVERNAAALGILSNEMNYQLSGEVSDETSFSIGKQLGAEIIISGALTRLGQNWRLDVNALRVDSAQRVAQWSAENIRPDPSWASLASPRSAALSFAGDPVAARDRQTVTDGLRNAMQAFNTALDLDENMAAGTGYFYTVTVYRKQINAVGYDLLQADVTVAFSQGGRVLCQTGLYNITETTEAMIARRIAERLQADRAFFNRINEAVR